MPKQRGVLMAYDEHLVETARALEVPTTLPDLPAEGFDREAERLRLEHALTEAGLVWQVRRGLAARPGCVRPSLSPRAATRSPG